MTGDPAGAFTPQRGLPFGPLQGLDRDPRRQRRWQSRWRCRCGGGVPGHDAGRVGHVAGIRRTGRMAVCVGVALWLAVRGRRRPAGEVNGGAGVSAARGGGARAHDHTDQPHPGDDLAGRVAGVGVGTGQVGRCPPAARFRSRVPDRWNARLWGRTGCRFTAAAAIARPATATGCYQCRGWGEIPATLAEYDMDSWDHLDFYDVSMVDGSNLPMYITIARGRPGTGSRRTGASGAPAAHRRSDARRRCRSTAAGGSSPASRRAHGFGTDRYCCRGQYADGCSPATTWPIDYARVFKRAEPYAYSWSGDDATSVFTCAGGATTG